MEWGGSSRDRGGGWDRLSNKGDKKPYGNPLLQNSDS